MSDSKADTSVPDKSMNKASMQQSSPAPVAGGKSDPKSSSSTLPPVAHSKDSSSSSSSTSSSTSSSSVSSNRGKGEDAAEHSSADTKSKQQTRHATSSSRNAISNTAVPAASAAPADSSTHSDHKDHRSSTSSPSSSSSSSSNATAENNATRISSSSNGRPLNKKGGSHHQHQLASSGSSDQSQGENRIQAGQSHPASQSGSFHERPFDKDNRRGTDNRSFKNASSTSSGPISPEKHQQPRSSPFASRQKSASGDYHSEHKASSAYKSGVSQRSQQHAEKQAQASYSQAAKTANSTDDYSKPSAVATSGAPSAEAAPLASSSSSYSSNSSSVVRDATHQAASSHSQTFNHSLSSFLYPHRSIEPKIRILVVNDVRGKLTLLNNLAKAEHVDAVINTGNFGFYDDQSYSFLQALDLRNRIVKSTRNIKEKHLTSHLSDHELRNYGRSNYSLSELPLFIQGKKKLVVPIYTIWGQHEDVRVVEKFQNGDYKVSNLHVLSESSSHVLGPLRLFGLGGNVLHYKLFDHGLGKDIVAGDAGKMWTTMLQLATLAKTARSYVNEVISLNDFSSFLSASSSSTSSSAPAVAAAVNNSDSTHASSDPIPLTRVLVSHVGSGLDALIAQLAYEIQADMTISGNIHSLHCSTYTDGSVVTADQQNSRLKNVTDDILSIWEQVKDVVYSKCSKDEAILIESVITMVQTHKTVANASDDRWKSMLHMCMPSWENGYAILSVDKKGTISLETHSEGRDLNPGTRKQQQSNASSSSSQKLNGTTTPQNVTESSKVAQPSSHQAKPSKTAPALSANNSATNSSTSTTATPPSSNAAVPTGNSSSMPSLNSAIASVATSDTRKGEEDNESDGNDSHDTSKPAFVAFIRFLPHTATKQNVEQLFKKAKKISLPTLPKGGIKGFGYIEFENQADLDEALKLDKTTYLDKVISVVVSTPPENRTDHEPKPYRPSRGFSGSGGRNLSSYPNSFSDKGGKYHSYNRDNKSTK